MKESKKASQKASEQLGPPSLGDEGLIDLGEE